MGTRLPITFNSRFNLFFIRYTCARIGYNVSLDNLLWYIYIYIHIYLTLALGMCYICDFHVIAQPELVLVGVKLLILHGTGIPKNFSRLSLRGNW